MSVTNAKSIVKAILDVLMQLQLPIHELLGNCWMWDGCGTVFDKTAGVADHVSELEPRAVLTHCFVHALSPAMNMVKQSSIMNDCLDCCYEIVQLVIQFFFIHRLIFRTVLKMNSLL